MKCQRYEAHEDNLPEATYLVTSDVIRLLVCSECAKVARELPGRSPGALTVVGIKGPLVRNQIKTLTNRA